MQCNEFNVDVKKILDIVINSVYTNKDIFLRELISNSADACEKLRYYALSDEKYNKYQNVNFKIKVEIDKKNKTIRISDNGIGLSKEDLIKNLGTIAHSGTAEFLNKIKDSTNPNNNNDNLIGQFGIGFYSAYLVANKVEVRSRHAIGESYHLWTSDGKSNFTIEELPEYNNQFSTEITLFIKEDSEEYINRFKIKHIVESYSNHIFYPVEIVFIGEKEEENTTDTIIQKVPLWSRNKNEVKKEEYIEFYQSLSNSRGEPFGIIHKKAEGIIEFNSLLFIPFDRPFDIFNQDRKTQVKLYKNKVFITDQGDLLPPYLRFVRGVVECNDLSLNISRETVQNNSKIKTIREKNTSDVLKFLLEEKKNNKENYDKFWNNLGITLKEGLCEQDYFNNREKLLSLVQFKTLKHQDKFISFEEYINEMKVEQKDILYLISDNFEDSLVSPYLEKIKNTDYDVVIFTDPVDSFFLSLIHEFKGKNFVNIADSELQTEEKNNKNEDIKDINEEEQKEAISLFEDALKGKVKKVLISKKLDKSAACISTDPGAMTTSMEEMLIQQGQLKERSKKNFEINLKNPLIQNALKYLKSESDIEKDKGKKILNVILGLTKISQGEFPKDKINFSNETMSLLQDLVEC